MEDILKDIEAQLKHDPKQAYLCFDHDSDYFTPEMRAEIEAKFPTYSVNIGCGRGEGSWIQLLPKQ